MFLGGEDEADFGAALAAPDLNGDGSRDLAVGAPLEDVTIIGTMGNAGSTYTYLMNAPKPEVYCGPKINSLGCTPQISYTGVPSLGTTDNFRIHANYVRNQKMGVMIWSLQAATTPFQGGVLCLGLPVKRTPAQNAGGSPDGNNCTGSYSVLFNSVYAGLNNLHAGQKVHAQFWSRDGGASYSSGLTNALEFTLLQ